MKNWHVSILTLFPEMFPGPLAYSIAGKALEKQLFNLDVYNIRGYALDKNHTVDDKVFGGGAGMLMRADVIANAIDNVVAKNQVKKLIYFTPRGEKFNQKVAQQLICEDKVLMLCGRYEGIDQRVFQKYEFEEYSIGDYVLSGGEIAALTVLDSCIRLLPGVLEKADAKNFESFATGGYDNLLEYDQYTRPAIWEGRGVPEVLLSGNHEEIAKWRLENAIINTKNADQIYQVNHY